MEFYFDRYDNKDILDQCYFKDIQVKGYYSVNEDSSIISFDSSQLHYYIPRKNSNADIDLNIGIENIRRCRHIYEKFNPDLGYILQWINKNHENIQASSKNERWLEPNFIMCHIILMKLLRTPIESKDQWVICAAKWKGSIYLSLFDSKEHIAQRKHSLRYYSKKLFWFKKFQQHMISSSVNGSSVTHRPANQDAKFHCIFQSRLGRHLLLYSNRIDAVCTNEMLTDPLPLEKLKFVRLKTHNICETQYQRYLFAKHRTFKWWTLSVAIGFENLLCGFQDTNGIVKELRLYGIRDFVKIGKQYWDSSVPLNFCNDFLTYVANTVVDNCNQTIYKFERIPNGNIEMTEVLPFSQYSFLPEWYTQDIV